jgi:hypothetical protein
MTSPPAGSSNEIGNYSGEVVVPDGTAILSIEECLDPPSTCCGQETWRNTDVGCAAEQWGGGLALADKTGCLGSTPDRRPAHRTWEGQSIQWVQSTA